MDIRKELSVKSLRELLIITACLSHSNKRTQATDIQKEEIIKNINLPCVEGVSEKLRRILTFHKIRSTFYTKSTLRKLLFKSKDRDPTENKNNIVYKIGCSTRKAVQCGESKQSLKSRLDEHKRSVRISDCEKNKIAKHCWKVDYNFSWDQKKLADRESNLIPKKIKENIYSLKNSNQINLFLSNAPFFYLLKTSENRNGVEKGCSGNERVNKIFFMRSETWLPNLRQFLHSWKPPPPLLKGVAPSKN